MLSTLALVQGGDTGVLEHMSSVLRWLHVWAGVIWVGHLYFFNFVNSFTMPKLDGPTKKALVPQLMPRALFWFRMGAAMTWVTGIVLFAIIYMMQKNFWEGQSSANPISNRGWWILLGVVFGTVMAFNVWFIIWPNQKNKIIPAIRDGVAPDAAAVKLATNASKLNTYLSVPLLASMVSQHFSMWIGQPMIYIPVVCVTGWGFTWLLYKQSANVKSM